MAKQDFKTWLLSKAVQKWADDNSEMMKDIMNLVDECLVFEVKYGIPVGLELRKKQDYANKPFGRELKKK